MNIDIGTILTAISVFVAIFVALWQIYRFKTEREEAKIATFRTSLLEVKGRVRYILKKPGQAPWMDIAISAINQVSEYLHDVKSKSELLEVLTEDDSIRSCLVEVIHTGICKSDARNKAIGDVNETMLLLSRHDFDMPLTIEVIRNSLWFMSIATMIYIDTAASDESFDKIDSYLQELKTENIDIVYRNIICKLHENILSSYSNIGEPIIFSASKIINIVIDNLLQLDNKSLTKMQEWDKKIFFKIPPCDDIFEELVADWYNFRDNIEPKGYIKPNDFSVGCVEIRRIIDLLTPYLILDSQNKEFYLIEKYPDVMNVALPRFIK